ncbi:hydroxypyruvate isomerase family protein [Gemmatimonas phototrophica]|uniref:Hydroxypyruvate isomerase n=1 Tax=Gemmatimonas phototrophica TaxID=1379270 RepID=A0A143BJE5_9BACT|nr:TIM barrel protein [Gemmatimonas phototrophica]AMW05186.1 hydroxypyruvate isomerase [Gemmatimonas phototrophica]
MLRRETDSNVSRRDALTTLGATAMAGALHGVIPSSTSAMSAPIIASPAPTAGRLRQSVARWCFSRTPIAELCTTAKQVGLVGIDLLGPEEWNVPKQFGLECTMGNSFGTIPVGFNRPANHDKLVADGEAYIPKAAAAGVTKVVVFSGNRDGMSDGEGIANCIAGLKRLMPTAQQHGVVLCMEMLNSKVDHKDYHADHTAWAVEVAKGVNSPSFRLLYDIYHMQVMEGDVMATIKANLPWIAHFHTAGVPGRNEIDGAQELNYRGIAQYIAGTSYTGVFAHEFIPTRDGVASLTDAVALCTV